MPPMNENPTGPLDRDGRVQTNLGCLKCGYNLRTLPADGLCPECATPVERSVRGDLLRYAQPDWVRRLATGAEVLHIAAGLILLARVAGALGAMILAASGGETFEFLGLAVAIPAEIIGGLSPLFGLAGVLQLCAREPRSGLRAEGLSARRACRYALLLAAVFLVFALVVELIARGSMPRWLAVLPVAAAVILSCTVAPLGALTHLVRLLRRVPDARLVFRAKALAAGALVFEALFATAIPLQRLLGDPNGIGFIVALCGPSGLALVILGLGVFKRARQVFWQAADQATLNAAQPGAYSNLKSKRGVR